MDSGRFSGRRWIERGIYQQPMPPDRPISPDDVVALAPQLHDQGLSPWSIKRILGALSSILSYALRRGYISQHPFASLERDERPHPSRSDQRVLARAEIVRLLSAALRGTGHC